MTVSKKATKAAIKAPPSSHATIKSVSGDLEALALLDAKALNAKFDEMLLAFNPEACRAEAVRAESGSFLKLTKGERGFSLSQILAQALQNEDRAMLETALCVSSAQHTEVLNTSLLKLPQTSILPLLQALNTRITENPRRTTQLLPWVRALLTCHAAYLSTLPSALKLLAPLQQIAEERMAAIPALLRLQGRLELLLSQAALREKHQAASTVSGALMTEEPLAVYDESESEEEVERLDETEASDESEMEVDDFEANEDDEEDEEDSEDAMDSDEMDEDDY